ncbi:fasciclin domain-containing protein [Leptothoe spongobia]|uniref:Fasciclin domain-containing protein n=1 Tax=Leptothoe spongobia TAU-MAC 1115 TaxID=1967444 RepID=A0A947DJV8_9CYAN|nr:fasciclin domain-containing protein [Leptothoe spongobia]MBT9317226.1 fasciclin domain-containing protein [Leptothoe spongobia TAU-MAC 1115]
MATIVDIAVNNPGFETLVAAVKAANLVETLQGEGPFTVFAPNDDAFAKLPPNTVNNLVQNPPQLGRILCYHVVSGRWDSASLAQLSELTSVEGSPIPIRSHEPLEIKNASVIAADIEASNGIIHVIDNVILMG